MKPCRYLPGLALASLLAGCESTGPAVATHVVFVTQPVAPRLSTQSLGSVMVAFLDGDGRVVASATSDVQIALEDAGTGAVLSGTTSVTPHNGVATFSDLSIDKAGAAHRLTATASGLGSVTSQPFSITVGPATKLRFETMISQHTAGAPIQPIMVCVTDAGGNPVLTATHTITLTTGGGTVIFGTAAKAAVAGAAVFDGLSIQLAAFSHTIVATAANIMSATSNSFTIVPAEMTKLTFTAQPTQGTAGAALPSFTVAATDVYGNPPLIPPGGSISVAVSLGNNPTGATLSGTLSVSGFAVATVFNNVTVDKPGNGYTLVASTSGPPALASGTSSLFNVVP